MLGLYSFENCVYIYNYINNPKLKPSLLVVLYYKDYLYQKYLPRVSQILKTYSYSRNCYCKSHGLAYSIQLLKKEKRISEKVIPGFDVRVVINLTTTSRTKLHLVWN